jgi:hypothetical protein
MRRGCALLASTLACACLPADVRPPPGEISVELAAATDAIRTVVTDDGWTVRFDRVVVTLGGVDVEGDDCTEYADADYTRVLDALADRPQKIALVYGLGRCTLELRGRSPEADSLLGDGVTAAEKFDFREPGSDPFVRDAGTAYLVRGEAVRGAVRKTFALRLRTRRLVYRECTVDGEPLLLESGGRRSIAISVVPAMLFRSSFDSTQAGLRFEPFARADRDGDGAVTIEELSAVALTDVGLAPPTGPDAPDGSENWKTLGDLVQRGLFPRIVGLGERSRCKVQLRLD